MSSPIMAHEILPATECRQHKELLILSQFRGKCKAGRAPLIPGGPPGLLLDVRAWRANP
jgi:hypothetical protein